MKDRHHTTGILLMALAMLSITAVDGLAKYLARDYSPLFLSWARYVVASAVVLPTAALRHRGQIFPAERRGSHIVRTLLLVVAMTLYFLSVARIPLATANSVALISPLIAVALSIVVLKERMTLRKGVSLMLGSIGSMVILRPGGELDWGILLALGTGITFGLYLVATRQASQFSGPLKTLAFQCAFGALLLTPQALYGWSVPQPEDLIFFAALGLISATSHMLSIAAFRLVDASTLAPLVYLELVGAALIGFFVFREVPDLPTVLGAAFIVAAGLILLQRRPMGM